MRPPPGVSQNAKTLSAVSLMDCMEQGGSDCAATVPLESYESTSDETVPLLPSPSATTTATNKEATATVATVAMETAPLLSPSSTAAGEKEKEEKEEEKEGSKEEPPQPLTGAQLGDVKKEEGKNYWQT